MYAIIELKGKQYKVEKGQELYVDLLDSETGSSVEIDKVLLLNDDKNVQVGQPYVTGAAVKVKVEKEVKGQKLVVFKFKRKKRYKKKKGHRQNYNKITVEEILVK
jgi:large subunit ribosomal protein L21